MKKEIYPSTDAMRTLDAHLMVLRQFLDQVFSRGFFRVVPIEDKIEYLKALADARAELWNEVYRVYPTLKGQGLSFGQKEITITT